MGRPTLLPARTFNWSKDYLPSINHYFEHRPAEQLLGDALDRFGDGLVMATGFGTSGVVLMHMLSQLRPQTTVFYLQTDLLFPETMALRDRLVDRLGIRFTEVHCGLSLGEQADQHGPDLWTHNPDLCCHLRKVVPLRRYLVDKNAWITGLRRDQSAARANTPLVAWDAVNGLVKLNPLAGWTRKDIWRYLYLNDLPYNELHDHGYPSIGCQPCTRAVAPGEAERAGRWADREKTECGIHLQPLQLEAA